MSTAEQVLMWTGVVGVAGAIFSTCYAAFKVSYEKVFRHPLPRILLVKLIELFVELLVNLPGAVNKGIQMGGGAPLFLHPTPPSSPIVVSTQDSGETFSPE
jgi:hypothetical protein